MPTKNRLKALADAAEDARWSYIEAHYALDVATRAVMKLPTPMLPAIRRAATARKRLARATKAYDRAVDALTAAKRASRRKSTGRRQK